MVTWLQRDVEEAAAIAESIRAVDVPRRGPRQERITIRLSESGPFHKNLSSTYRAVPIRQLSHLMGLDEHRPFLWRLEHKLVQALVLDQLCPGHVAVTLGLGRYAAGIHKNDLRGKLHEEFTLWGFYLKPSMGDSSGERPVIDDSHVILKDIELGKIRLGNPVAITDEAWLLQRRLSIKNEYRVHSIEDRVIDNLTYNRYGRGDIPRERDAPNAYIQGVLDRLPAGFVGGSLLGWDVAWLGDRFGIVEVNFCGFHPVFRRGYQCSGYYQDWEWGASMTARLLRFLERADGIRIDVEADDRQNPGWWFYNKLSKWMPLLRAEGK
jgi:hypothetical protein